MNFDEWFNEQERLVKIIFLFIPIIGWLIEILVRVSALVKSQSTTNILGLIIFVLGGYIFQFFDLIYLAITDKMLLVEEKEDD
jgi:uncharacterized membrane protein YbhN (UPF0104 family)